MSAPKRPVPPKCGDCDGRLLSSGPRVQDGATWYCPDCWYRRERQRERAPLVVPIRESA